MTAAPEVRARLAEAVVPLAYVLLTPFLSPHLPRFQVNTDEGFNLAKAALVGRGHALYAEVWSDQPPLLTHALRALFAVTGESVLAARLLVLALAGVLLWSCARIARRAWGTPAALFAAGLVLLLPGFRQLSVAVMIGLPALALGTLALALAVESPRAASPRRAAALAAASGAVLALSAMVKLFTLILLPVLLAGLWAAGRRRGSSSPALAFSGAFAAVLAAVGAAWIGAAGAEQLFVPHVAAAADHVYRTDPQYGFLRYARHLEWLFLLAAAGLALSWRRRTALALYPAAWAGAGFGVMALHRPLWFHHLLLFTIPLALLAAPAAAGLYAVLAGRLARLVPARLVHAALAAGIAAGLLATAHPPPAPSAQEARAEPGLVARLRAAAGPGSRMLTDVPMFAFRAGVEVLPATAVLSQKRMRSGALTEDALRAEVERARPDLVLVGRFALPALREALQAGYHRAYARHGRELWIAPARGGPGPACRWPACLDLPPAWYAGAEARAIAGHVLAAQHADGGWAKNEDRALAPLVPVARDDGDCAAGLLEACSTVDNHATTAELRFLARVRGAAPRGDAAGRELERAFARGLDHLLAAQYPSGGWPQVPAAPAGSYHAAITFNDGANVRVLELLRDVADDPAFGFVDAPRRARAALALDRGVGMVLRAQVEIGGEKTAWGAQHDPVTLRPVAGRAYEPASLSGDESAGVVRLLAGLPPSRPGAREAVEAARRWFARAALPGPDGPRWARFYALDGRTPLFPDRDGTLREQYEDLSAERRTGYRYYTEAPRELLLGPATHAGVARRDGGAS